MPIKRPGVVLCALSLLWSARALADGARACPTAVQLEGEAALTRTIAKELASHGVVTQPPAGCPLSFIHVTSSPRGLVVSIHQPIALAERVVSDPAVAAALIESWMRSDLGELADSPLAAPDLMAAPPLLPAPPQAVPKPGPRVTVSLFFEPGVDKEGTAWLGGSLLGCASVGPLCLGALVRTAADVPASTVGTYSDQRVAVDVLASVGWPLRRGRWVVEPAIGLGAGWLRHKATPSENTSRHEEEDAVATGATPITGSDAGVRAELRLRVLLHLRAGWMLASTLAFGTALLDGPAAELPSGERLAVMPWAALRGGIGLAWSAQ